ncbi:RNA-directed DNA polymerase (reverse transcriptase)-related family protein [Rhynchospora pubera]|uniref:RNA-directed DNA polymerase (Reverse transcriptase)-related family protein n=1 Tax=Rhynchospora pubera TaxID=906938 RepID=A0AAV8D5Y2_9POAL|nr:RNA-directed DNA polymerase (reverse transcriptase)-related family protein [Rhynchospora pubera]
MKWGKARVAEEVEVTEAVKVFLFFLFEGQRIFRWRLPLTSKKPNKECFQPLLDKLEKKLATWKGTLLTRAGRLQLITSVLSAIPVYHMSCFCLPKWVIDRIEALSRKFLWATTAGGIPLKNWRSICLPKANGGFGVKDLALQNKALLLKWWWRLYTEKDSLWLTYMSALFARRHGHAAPLNWISSGSFFWKDLLALRLLFQISTKWALGEAKVPSFWYDAWAGQPLVFLTKPAISVDCTVTTPFITLQKALPLFLNLVPRPHNARISGITEEAAALGSTNNQDIILWKWTSDGNFASGPTYKQLASAGKTLSPAKFLWKLKVPPKVKIFAVLLFQRKLLTQQAMLRRSINIQTGCALCFSHLLEDDLHLFFTCPFSREVWRHVNLLTSLPTPLEKDTLVDTFLSSFGCHFGPQKKKWNCLFLTTLWAIWGERNNRTFRDLQKPVKVLARFITEEGALFYNFS